MADPGDVNQVEQLWKWALGAIGIGAAWLWNNTMGRIQALEKGKVDTKVFDDYAARAEITRTELRTGQATLFANLEKIGQQLARIEGRLDVHKPHD